jgi:O-antigen/teichoic acid export membrane protein
MTDAAVGQSGPPTTPKQHAQSLRRVGRGSTINLIGVFVAALANMVLALLVTHGLSKPQAGVFFSTTSIFLIALSVGQLGTPTGLVYFLSRARALNTSESVLAYFRAALRPVMASVCAAAVIMFVFAHQLASVTNPDHVDEAATYLRVLAIFVPLAGLEQVALSATRGMGTMKANAVIEQLTRPLVQVGLVGLALVSPAAGLLGLSWAFAYAPAALAAWWWWRRLYSRVASGGGDPQLSARYREFWSFSGPRSIATVAQLAMQRLDIVLVGALAGAPEAAVYAAATRFIVVGQMTRNAVSLAVQPPLAEALARESRSEANHLYEISTAWLMGVTWPLYLFLIVFGGPLLGIFGEGYSTGSGGVTVVVLLSIAMLVATFCGDVDIVLIMAAKTSWSLANVSLGFFVNLGLDLWLIPDHGVVGAAIGWAVAIMVKNLSALIQVAFALRLHPFGPATLVSGLISVVAFFGVAGIIRLTFGGGFGSFVAAIVVSTAVWLAGVWLARDMLQLSALRRLKNRRGQESPSVRAAETETAEGTD